MNLREAIIIVLEATREMDEPRTPLAAARKKLAARAEALRAKNARMWKSAQCLNAIQAGQIARGAQEVNHAVEQ